MKKYLHLIIALCLSASLVGCRTIPTTEYVPRTTEPSTDPLPSAPATTTPSVFPVAQLPLISVSLPRTTRTTYAGDGTIIYEEIGQNISLTVPDPEAANRIIVDFLKRTDTISVSEDSIQFAEQIYREHPENFMPHQLGMTFNPMRHDANILSLFGSITDYTGGVHGDYLFESVSYELTSGNKLSLTDILVSDADIDRLCQQVLDSLHEVQKSKVLFDSFETTVLQHFKQAPAQIDNWFLSNIGLCFFFSPYEIGPFSSMEIIAEIPYTELIGILDDAFFPAERELAAGTLFIQEFDKDALDQFTQFAELTLQDSNTKSLLYTDALIYDLRIECGEWSYDRSEFTPHYTVFSAYTLSPGDAIVLAAEPHDDDLTIRISYHTKGQSASYYLTSHGGTPQLSL